MAKDTRTNRLIRLCSWEDTNISVSDRYNNAFLMLIKYADMSIGMRNAVFVQGIIVLSGSGLLFSRGEYFWSFASSVFCLLLTFILNLLHVHYNAYFFSVRGYIKKLEKKFSRAGSPQYVDTVERMRDRRVGRPLFGWMKMFGPFVLIGISSTVMIVASAAMQFDILDLQPTHSTEIKKGAIHFEIDTSPINTNSHPSSGVLRFEINQSSFPEDAIKP